MKQKIHAPAAKITSPLGLADVAKEETAAGARGARPAAVLPCLNTNNCNESKSARSEQLSAGHRKTAFALQLNVLWMIEEYGLERIGFLTLTFARHIVSFKKAQKALHSLMTGVLKGRYAEYIIVMERMNSGRIHYHLLVVMAEDIRTGFDFAAVKHGNYGSASAFLRNEWKFWREIAPKYGFGRTELTPIKKTAEGVAKYIGKYIAKHIGQRLPEDKGARLVRYSKRAVRAGTRLSWVSSGAYMWRQKLGTFCRMLGCNSENYQHNLKEWFGKNWIYHLRPVIQSIKLAEFHSPEESQESLKAVWITMVRELERRNGQLHQTMPVNSWKPVLSVPKPSWIELTTKEDA